MLEVVALEEATTKGVSIDKASARLEELNVADLAHSIVLMCVICVHFCFMLTLSETKNIYFRLPQQNPGAEKKCQKRGQCETQVTAGVTH
jgi:hypothetical protein